MAWTKEQCKEMSRKGLEARRANSWQRLSERLKDPEPFQPDASNAQARSIRLWDCLHMIDKRIRRELMREQPNMTLARELGALSRVIAAQVGESPNGKKPGGKDQAPAMPEPEPPAE